MCYIIVGIQLTYQWIKYRRNLSRKINISARFSVTVIIFYGGYKIMSFVVNIQRTF